MIKRYRLEPSVWMTRTIMVRTPNRDVSRAPQQKSIVCLRVTTHPFLLFKLKVYRCDLLSFILHLGLLL